MPIPADEITRLLEAYESGDADALRRLVPLVYPDLRRLAHRQLGHGRGGQTLDTTGLVHEAYVKLADRTRACWRDRGHFFAVAALAMRQVVIDYARRCRAEKRGGGQPIDRLDATQIPVREQAETLLQLDEALERLRDLDERLIRVVECRFFAGLSEQETAEALGVSTRTVERDWKRARAWLRRDLGRRDRPAGSAHEPAG
jgi:RNA polymerase sigma factor (TIGR02999 family)